MRVAFVGASSLAITAARDLIEQGHEVVLIDRDPEIIEELGDKLDCGLIQGDGSRPAVLREVGPEQTAFLFCLSDSDEANVLGALVGRSLGYERVIPKIEDETLEPICTELGLDEVLVPDRTGSVHIRDLVEGRDNPAISAVVRTGLRFFSFSVREDGPRDVESLDLPRDVRAIAYSRGDESWLIDADTRLEAGDEVVVIGSDECIEELRERFARDSGNRHG